MSFIGLTSGELSSRCEEKTLSTRIWKCHDWQSELQLTANNVVLDSTLVIIINTQCNTEETYRNSIIFLVVPINLHLFGNKITLIFIV